MRLPNSDQNPIRHQLDVRRALAASQAVVCPGPLHRIAEVRSRQGVSVRAARQALLLSSEEVHMQEHENSDLRLSQLYKWQDLLDVPLCELLVEPQMQLSQPVSTRAALVKVMKTAMTILESARQPEIKTLGERLVEQLLEVMPELAGVSAWPAVGKRRTMEEYGRIAEHPLSAIQPED